MNQREKPHRNFKQLIGGSSWEPPVARAEPRQRRRLHQKAGGRRPEGFSAPGLSRAEKCGKPVELPPLERNSPFKPSAISTRVSVQSHAKPGQTTFTPSTPEAESLPISADADGPSHFKGPPICDCHTTETSASPAADASSPAVFRHCAE